MGKYQRSYGGMGKAQKIYYSSIEINSTRKVPEMFTICRTRNKYAAQNLRVFVLYRYEPIVLLEGRINASWDRQTEKQINKKIHNRVNQSTINRQQIVKKILYRNTMIGMIHIELERTQLFIQHKRDISKIKLLENMINIL